MTVASPHTRVTTVEGTFVVRGDALDIANKMLSGRDVGLLVTFTKQGGAKVYVNPEYVVKLEDY